ncbi:DUF4198 domain-containing protein [Paenibacillus hemerocallicola]|uniref:DUF4198 domain-containing protein n=1 Tax=Paenibacillus hemerocallicola TaxID=1172614 RepID=A0A5C4T1W6_9BACL|nr:DUF4198 domain-containing protein [Paenibacillus hemerocallicola]TNJ62257.1 DUF4198 domain-containing protein [Paenibacillus hemerocallicola]
MNWKKTMASTALSAALFMSVSVSAFAHDGWSQTKSPIIAPGEVSYVELLLGNHSNGHKSYRIAGQWSPDSSKVFVTPPSGKKADITSTRFYTGEAATETEPAVNNGFEASFSASAPGAYIITVEGDSMFKSAASASRTLRSAKSFVAVSDIPTVERVQALQGFSRPVNTDRAEIVPLFNPAAVTPKEQVSVQLLLKGTPLADTDVSLIRKSNSESQVFKTDAFGVITFETGAADYYLLRAKPSSAEKKEGEYDTVNYEATMTFSVQNGTARLPGINTNPVPFLYVNGKPVTDQEAVIEEGSARVNADFIRAYLDAGYAGNGTVTLRSAAEAAGATIEFLPAAGGLRAAILLYTKD